MVPVFLFLLLLSLGGKAGGERGFLGTGGAEERKVILLLVDRLTVDMIEDYGGVAAKTLFTRGAVSLMNARSARSNSESGYLSLGAGARAEAGFEGGMAFQRGEEVDGIPAEALYYLHTRREGVGELLHLHALFLREKNSNLDYPVKVGYLGHLLEEAGLTAAVLGNADGVGFARSAVMVAMNRYGEVPLGSVGDNILESDYRSPYGKHINPGALVSFTSIFLDEAELVVIDFGDLARLDRYWPQLNRSVRESLLQETISRLDEVIDGLLPMAGRGTLLMLATPSPPVNIPGEGELLPFALFSDGGAEAGLLRSATTRRSGLITNTDVAPLIYGYLTAGAPVSGGGLVLELVPVRNPLEELIDFAGRAGLVYRLRAPVVRGFITGQLVAFLLGLLALSLPRPAIRHGLIIFEAIMLVPLVLLLLPALTFFPHPSAYWTGAMIVGAVTFLLLILGPVKKRGANAFWAVVGLSISLALVLDTLAGAPLQQASILGYDPVAGARYYGIGNEYMGALIGSTVLACFSLSSILDGGSSGGRGKLYRAGRKKIFFPVTLFYYLVIVVLLASPAFGANFGGTIAAALAFGVSWSFLRGDLTLDRKTVFTALIFLAAALVILYIVNVWQGFSQPSHLGQFEEMVRERGPGGFWETVLRKINMNWRLIRYSLWSRAFALLLGLMAVIVFYPAGLIRELKKEQPHLVHGAAAGLAGSIAALLANDSGIVAAAMVLLFTVPPMLIMIARKIIDRKKVNGC